MFPVESGLAGPWRDTNASSWPSANSPSNWNAGKIFNSAKASVNDDMYLMVNHYEIKWSCAIILIWSYLRNSSTVWGIQTGRNQNRGWRMPTLTIIACQSVHCLLFSLKILATFPNIHQFSFKYKCTCILDIGWRRFDVYTNKLSSSWRCVGCNTLISDLTICIWRTTLCILWYQDLSSW